MSVDLEFGQMVGLIKANNASYAGIVSLVTNMPCNHKGGFNES
jgi:hypothetical protein